MPALFFYKLQYKRHGSDLNRRIGVLQTPALPLGYRANIIKLGYQDSNLGMTVPKTVALPLGHSPIFKKERRMTGIEPAFSAWEADVLPLNYIRSAIAG